MKKIILSAVFLTIFASIMALAPITAQAQNFLNIEEQEGFNSGSGNIPQAFGQKTSNPTDIRLIIIRIIKIALSLLGIIFIILLIVAGFKYMTSQGNETTIEEAKGQIIAAIIGLLIILASYGITTFVFNSIMKSTKSGFSVTQ